MIEVISVRVAVWVNAFGAPSLTFNAVDNTSERFTVSILYALAPDTKVSAVTDPAEFNVKLAISALLIINALTKPVAPLSQS